ncbi:MAG: hypothetical protein ACOX47_13415 [Bacillota bacterium]|jgi:hypothetical protein
MKKILGIILIFTLIATTTGCSKGDNLSGRQKTYNNESSPSNSRIPNGKEFSKDDALAIFKANNDINDYEVTDSVLVDDDKIPRLKAVILFYDKKENNSCNLAFITEGSAQKINFAVNEVEGVQSFEIADGSRLSYKGNGAVTTSIRNIKTNEIFDYTVIYSYEESTSTTNFKAISDKHTE